MSPDMKASPPLNELLIKLVTLAFSFPEKFLHALENSGLDFKLFNYNKKLYETITFLFDLIDSESLDTSESIDPLFFKQAFINTRKPGLPKKMKMAIIKLLENHVFNEMDSGENISDNELQRTFKYAYSHKVSLNSSKLLADYKNKLSINPENSLNLVNSLLNELKSVISFGNTIPTFYTLKESLSEKIKKEHALIASGKKLWGYETGFPILTEKTGGFEKELYVIAGASGMGKSTLLIQLAWQLVQQSENVKVALFTLDHNHIDVTTKIIAQAGNLSIKYVKNPFIPDVELENKRHNAIKMATDIKERLHIIDEGHGSLSLTDIENYIHASRATSSEDEELIVIIDPVMKLSCPGTEFNPEKEIILSRNLRRISRENNICIICSLDLTGKAQIVPPEKKHLNEYPSFLSEAYVLIMMYCDYVNNFETLFLEWQWNSDDLMVPITEISVIKNKMDEYRGKLFFRYFNSMAFYKECAPEEIQNYNQMLENLNEWVDKEVAVQPDGTTRPMPKS